MKYQYEISNDPRTSHGRILAHIPRGATVLECGCATGYMTRYLGQEMGCRVSIIEYEQEAYEIAKQYAVDGLCCDLMGQEWLSHFTGQQFDVILFVDVLEHLSAPEKVLASAATLLKDDGLILVSIPNVAHNDIILKLLHNRWDYTRTGLLDDTHIHFWGAENLKELAQKAGLEIICLEGLEQPTLTTEQSDGKLDSKEYQFLQTHRYGEVYQFVLTLQKQAYVEQNQIALDNRLPEHTGFGQNYDSDKIRVATLYLADAKDDYLSAQKIYASYGVGYQMQVHIEAEIPDSTQELRLDPAEESCVISSFHASCDGKPLSYRASNGMTFDGLWAFSTEDPQIIIPIPAGSARKVCIDYSICFDSGVISWASKRIKPFQLGVKICRKFRNCFRRR